MKAVNDSFMDLKRIVYMLKHDSLREQFPGTIATTEADGKEHLVVNGAEAQIFHETSNPVDDFDDCNFDV